MKIFKLLWFIALISFFSSPKIHAQKGVQYIKIDPHSAGHEFLGIGALSAGASSRLLLDYPEAQRAQIFDLLFKPNFGASLQILKVEIGGDINSTDGTEPSFAHGRQEFLTPAEDYFHRGYEWLLMKEAKKRNPDIALDALQWGAPGWIGNGRFYSKDNINYIVSFIKNEKKYDSLTIDYAGLWNERMYDTGYIKAFRKALDSNHLEHVKIVAADQCCGEEWSIKKYIQHDENLLNSIGVFGDHYPDNYQSDDILKATGKPIENSEGGSVQSNWDGFKSLVKMYNRDYIAGKMSGQITWALITSYYDNLSIPNCGLMKANTPWSGHFDISPTVWAAAHTTQFAKPGWKYVEDACGFLPDSSGSYVTLISPDSPHNYSIIIETMNASKEQKLDLELSGNLSAHGLSVWRSVLNKETFIRQKNIIPHGNKFSITIQPNAVYSLTTITGQEKGNYASPENTPFPVPYHTDFEQDRLNQLPKYFADQAGVFEVRKDLSGKGKCMQQVMQKEGIEWSPNGAFVETLIGDTTWTDYEVSAKVNVIQNTGSAKILGRITETYRGSRPPDGYWFEIYTGGKWTLYAGEKAIKSGYAGFNPFVWHNLRMVFKGNSVNVFVDQREIVAVQNNEYTHGMAGLGCGFNLTQFDDFSIKKSAN